ncbi:MAG: methyltransferase [Flavobacteriales bacterium]|nr:methyltransferase [Flavobacteriales bacterium]
MEFQRFTVKDEKCAMKIGTDGVLLGAWASMQSPEKTLDIVDVGSGSGVVALMLAQRFTESKVTAVELEPLAVEQSRENFENSPFNSRINCVEASFQDWANESGNQSSFDLVVSNPPFFNGKPKSPFHARNLARHDDYLNISDLFEGAEKVLRAEGVFGLVWPVEREVDLMAAAKVRNFYVIRKCVIRPTPQHNPVRFLVEFKKDTCGTQNVPNIIPTNIVLETGEGVGRQFTSQHNELMKAFFLKT